jgi:FkbM family methyltransferase
MADEVVDTPFGKFLVNPAECIGGTVKAGTVWDGPGFLQVIAREHACFGEVGTTILDIGAHLGDWTVWCCGQGAWRVVAVEPAPVMIEYLKANLDLNKPVCADRVILIPAAAYDRQTELVWTEPYVAQDSGGAALRQIQDGEATARTGDGRVVPAVQLDDYRLHLFGERVSLIKIDAQGSDFRALVGLSETIARDRPVIVFEWEQRLADEHGDTLPRCLAWLAERGYFVQEWPSHLQNYLALPQEGR